MKNNNALFIVVLIIFAILIIGNRYQGSVQGIGGLDNSFFTTWDWTSFTFVQTYLGGYGNILIWLLVGLAIFWIITSMFQGKIEHGVSGWIFFLILITVIIIAVSNSGGKEAEAKVTKSSFVNVRLFGIRIGESRIVSMNIATTANVSIPSSRKAGSGTTNIACAEIVKPLWLKKMEGFPDKHLGYNNPQPSQVDNFKFTKEMKKFLVENDAIGAEIEVKFTLVETKYGTSNCPHSTSPWSK